MAREAFGVGAVVAATLAQASLLLGLAHRARKAVRRILLATLALAAVLAAMVGYLILGPEPSGSVYFRLLGVVAILDVLGTVVVAALTRFGQGAPRPAPPPTAITVPPALAARLAAEAERTGRAPEALLDEAVERYLAGTGIPAAAQDDA